MNLLWSIIRDKKENINMRYENKKMLSRVYNLLKKHKRFQSKLGSLEHAIKQVKYY